MRRIAFVLILLAAIAGLHACAADAPTNPGPGPSPGPGTALQIQLVTSDANPPSGTCTLIQATATVNGVNVPDGSSVNFSTDFGAFGQNGLPLVSVVTNNGVAVTALCGPSAGQARVRATATIGGNTGAASIVISFQPSNNTLPFVSSCSPSFGPKEGGTVLTLNGGRFFGNVSTTRVQFTVNGVTKDGIVQSVTQNQIVVLTPGFPEFSSPGLLTQVTVSLGTNQVPPTVLSLPSCFAYGTQDAGTPQVSSLLPSSGTSEGGTRVTIVGSGFSVGGGVQVFFGALEATVVSVSFNQVVVLSPLQVGQPTPVTVTVKNIASGAVSNGVTYVYTEPMIITGFNNNVQPLGGPFLPMTIFGRGFEAPVAVDLAGWAAIIQSVSATEIVVVPGPALSAGCADITGPISITNLNTGSSVQDGSFTYLVVKPIISSVVPNAGPGGTGVSITGFNLPDNLPDTEVKFGSQTALVTSASSTVITVTAPTSNLAPPTCTGANPAGTLQTAATVDVSVTDRETTCAVVAAQAFQEQLPCVLPPTPTP